MLNSRSILSPLTLCLLIGCTRSPTMLVSVENVPMDAGSLSVFATHESDAVVLPSMDLLHPYDLTLPAANQISFLLRLPDSFNGDLTVDVAAMEHADADGCLLRSGSTSRMFMPNPLDDAMTVSLKDPSVKDVQCSGIPRLFSAAPRVGGTSGGQMVTITGWGFRPGADVYFGDQPAASVTYLSATSLQVMTPRFMVSGLVPLKVVNPDGAQTVVNDIFRYAYDTIAFSSSAIASNMITDFVITPLDNSNNDVSDLLYTNIYADNSAAIGTLLFPSRGGATYKYLSNPGLSNIGILDINQDGYNDVALAVRNQDQLSIRINNGAGMFGPSQPYDVVPGMSMVYPSAIAVGDVDGDHLPDVVTANQSYTTSPSAPATFSLLLNNGIGGFQTAKSFPLKSVTVPAAIVLLDLNGDQLIDVYISDASSGKSVIIFNQGSGKFDSTTTGSGYFLLPGPPTTSPPVLSTYDVDGDNRPDLVIAQESANGVGINLTTGQLAFNETVITTSTPRRVTFGDINGDGLADLIVLNAGAPAVDIFLQQLRSQPSDPFFLTTPVVSVPLLSSSLGNPSQIAVTDTVPYDGKLDIVVSGSSGFIFLQNISQ